MARKGPAYSREFKIEAVRLSYISEKGVEAVAEELGISRSTMYRWRKEFGADPDQAFPGKGQRTEKDAEIARLKKELREARMENEILKKAAAIFAKTKR